MPDLVSPLMNVPLTKTVTQTSSTTVSLEHILKVVSTDIELLELKILNDVKTDIPLLNNVADHILSSGGKRLRPALVLLGAEMFDGVDERVMQAAQVIEYLHTATLLHDDVVDGAETRRAKQAVCKVWGNEASVLSGDYLLSMAFHHLTKLRNLEVLELMSETTTKMARGELLQLTRSFEAANEEEYLEIIINKTACLLQLQLRLAPYWLVRQANPQISCMITEWHWEYHFRLWMMLLIMQMKIKLENLLAGICRNVK